MSEAEIHAWMAEQSQARPEWSPPVQQEVIDKPDRYGGDACMNAIAASLTPEELRGFIKGMLIVSQKMLEKI